MVFSAFPRSGVQPRFDNYEAFAEVVGQLETHRLEFADYTHIWWDVRPHPRLGTIELGIFNAVGPCRGRRCACGLLPGAREDALGARRVSRHAAELPPDPDHREQVARCPPRPCGPCHGISSPGGATGCRSRSSSGGRSATSSRTRASSAPSASSRESRRSSHAATAPRSSFASGTRTATSRRIVQELAAATEVGATDVPELEARGARFLHRRFGGLSLNRGQTSLEAKGPTWRRFGLSPCRDRGRGAFGGGQFSRRCQTYFTVVTRLYRSSTKPLGNSADSEL